MTRALIVGAGSIGLRHAEVLTQLGLKCAFVSSRSDLEGEVFPTISAAMTCHSFDYVVIANETSRHQQALHSLLESRYCGKVLIEKPAQIFFEQEKVANFERVGVGYNLRFNPLMTAVREKLLGQKIITVQAYAGQDLDGWRPGRPSHEQYSAHRAFGGGVLRDLSHELDYLQWLCGEAREVTALGGRFTSKTVDSDDAWSILFSTDTTPQVALSLNYLDRPGARLLHIVAETQTLNADFITGRLSINGDEVQTFHSDRNDSYRLMHESMLNDGSDITSVQSAMNTDRLILDIELSATQKKWIQR